MRTLTCTLMALVAASASGSSSSVEERQAALQRLFPPEGKGFRVEDIELFYAVSQGNVLAFAKRAVPGTAENLEDKQGYGLAQEEKRIRADPEVKAMLAHFRTALSKAFLYLPVGDGDARVEYVSGEHRFITCGPEQSNKTSCSIFARGTDASTNNAYLVAVQISSYICQSLPLGNMQCGVGLRGMPKQLKETLEGEIGKTIHARWRWSGLFLSNVKKATDPFGGVILFYAPKNLVLEVTGDPEQVLWSAK